MLLHFKFLKVFILFTCINFLAPQIKGQINWVNAGDFGVIAGSDKVDNYSNLLSAINFAEKKHITHIKIPAGTFYISKGFTLEDNFTISGAGMDKTILRMMTNLPARSDEASQTAVFTGKKSFSLSHAGTTRNITIKSLTIDLQKPPLEFKLENFCMLGGIRLINPVNCLIDSVKIVNPPKFGIGLYATVNGVSCSSNTIQNSVVEMQNNWYLQLTPEIIPRSNESCIGIEIASPTGNNNNGAAKSLTRSDADYIATKARKNTVKNTIISGGSHGISVSNASNNIFLNNTVRDCSARGFIIITCADSNLVANNIIVNIGSTAVHMAYDCNFNIIKDNIINGVLGVEGDGIKSYINCNHNQITGNTISNFARTGIRVSHGANKNLIDHNKITGNNISYQIGIKIISNNEKQYQEGFVYNNQLTANDNTCTYNNISDVPTGVLINDEAKLSNKLKGNKTNGNIFKNVPKDYNIKVD